ncbi:MAG: nucleoside monophosphate kinase [Candidatus Aminicenantes bacterium]|nr:nucleoside monophosphate kinase [Candidatus Aminicenantes bacterium]
MSGIKAILLLGPPGSGKTPLGEYLSAQRFASRSAFHFDFGQQLRDLVNTGAQGVFTPREICRVKEAIKQAALFEKEDRELVRKILADFVKRHDLQPGDWLILNGLPRHPEQVDWVSELVEIKLVVHLLCPLEISQKRITTGFLEDRSERSDDSPEKLTARYQTYLERTLPMVNFFREKKIPVVELAVLENTTPPVLWQELQSHEAFKSVISS